jgi:prophage endopeptidase
MIAALKLVPVWVWGVVVLIIALCAGSFAAAWLWQANAYGKVIATNASNYQADRTLIANAASAQARDALAKQQEAETRAAANDAKYTKEKADDLAKNESLRRAVADGTRRLRISGTCTANSNGSGGVPQAASSASLGDAATVELSGAAGQAVLDLRAELVAEGAALRVLQSYVKNVCAGL